MLHICVFVSEKGVTQYQRLSLQKSQSTGAEVTSSTNSGLQGTRMLSHACVPLRTWVDTSTPNTNSVPIYCLIEKSSQVCHIFASNEQSLL